jgi:hypothetical protein
MKAGELSQRRRGWPRVSRDQHGFTRLDAAAVFAAITLLGFVVWPALADSRSRSNRVVCANNLRQVGAALLIWGHDHSDLPPFEVATNQGGTLLHVLAVNPWLHFSWISNELRSPKILACPDDVSGKVAADFSADPKGGYLHPNFANRATSYFLSHANTQNPGALLAGDRNVKWSTADACNRFNFALNVPIGWNADLHQEQGNLVLFDGRVEQVSNARFRDATLPSMVFNNSLHLVLPR